MLMNKILLISIILISGYKLNAQQEKNSALTLKNNVTLSFLGNGSFMSLDYERLFFLAPNKFISNSFGIGGGSEIEFCLNGSSPCSSTKGLLTVPHSLTANWGRNRHFFEFGIGGTIVIGNTNENYFLYPILGWRIQPNKSKLGRNNFRLFVSVPFSGIETEDILWIPIGISYGVLF